MDLTLTEVLVYYDVPQVFLAKNAFGAQLICLLYDDLSVPDEYLYIATYITEERVNLFKGRHIDLLSIFQHPEEQFFFKVEVNKELRIVANEMNKDLVTTDMLPDEDFYCLYDSVDDDNLIRLSTTHNKIASCLAFSDERNSHAVDISILSRALANYQMLVSNCHIKFYGKNAADAVKMKAVAVQAASFDIDFIANEQLDLYGESSVGQTLGFVDKLISTTDTDKLAELVTIIKGNAVKSLRNFLGLMVQNHLSIRHKWVASLLEKKVSSISVSVQNMGSIYDYLTAHSDLEEEFVDFEGTFLTASVLREGKWTILKNDGKKVSGISEQQNLLNNVKLNSQRYKLHCRKEQEQECSTGKIKNKYILTSIEQC